MISRTHIENFLKANGVPPTAKDEEIRSVLLSASFNSNEVDTALLILKENIVSKKTHIDTLHKVFNSDDRLTPLEINTLLGINVNLSKDDVNDIVGKRRKFEQINTIVAIVLSTIIVFVGLSYLMYKRQAGPFYPSTVFSNAK